MTIGPCRFSLLARSLLPACLALVFAAPPAAGQVPATLTGETLKDPPGEGGTLAEMSCNPVLFGSASGSFNSAGVAAGPFPGTYTEQGSYTIQTAPRGGLFPRAEAFESTFTIVSGTTTITGKKTLREGNGRCEDDFGGGRDGVEIIVLVDYEAKIDTPDGDFTDRGTSEVVVQDRQVEAVPPPPPAMPRRLQEFIESFASGLTAPIPIEPPPPPPPPPGECDDDGTDGFTEDDCDDDGGGDG